MADPATMSERTSGPRAGLGAWRECVGQIFGSLAVRHGIKFGLAGVLSVFVALFLRLPEPTWALMTAFVIMLAQFVGAVAEKSVMRLVGTADRRRNRIFAYGPLRAAANSLSLADWRCRRFRHSHVRIHQVSLRVPALRADHDGCRKQRHERSQFLLEAGPRANRRSQRRRDLSGDCNKPYLAPVCTQGIPGKDARGLG